MSTAPTETLHEQCLRLSGVPFFDGYSYIRCPDMQALVRSWLNGAAGDGWTWLEIWAHLRDCPTCGAEREMT